MLTKRIIPCLDVREGRVVKGVRFVDLTDAGDPVELAAAYDRQGADELVFLDITASYEERDIMVEVAKGCAEQVFIPYTLGGGIRTTDDVRRLLKAGADKVSLNTAAVKDPQTVREASREFGSQCIVVAIDAKSVRGRMSEVGCRKTSEQQTANHTCLSTPEHLAVIARSDSDEAISAEQEQRDKWEVYINGGRTPTGTDAVEWAKKVEELGAGEILLTSMDRDGTKDGFDIPLTKTITDAVNIPVIASGGAGKLEHFLEVIQEADADAVLAASLFHYGELTVKGVKEYLTSNGIPIRL